jgi:tol-pal system protein YbgF
MLAMKKIVLVSLSLFALSSVFSTAHAALFDDKEARKKIVEVEAKAQSDHNAAMAAIADLKKSQAAMEKRIAAIEAIVQGGGLADMQNQIETLKQEVANLKGDLEVAQHNLDATQTRQKDLYTDTDTRLRKIEGGAPAASTSAPSAATPTQPATEEKDAKALADANALSQSGKHKEAFAAYDTFLRDYPTSKLAADALYGMGFSQYALRNYKSSIATQQKVLDLHPDSAKVPDAMYNMANGQIQLGQVSSAKKTLRDLIAKYPTATVTPSAQKRLKALEAIK